MTWRRNVCILGISVVAGFGCKRPPEPPAPAPTTRVSVAASQPATQPARSESLATFIINNQAFLFPSPKLVAVVKDNALRVTLFSNDPPEALREGYTGNSFYFRFNLDADHPDDLAGQQYVFRNSYTEQEDTTNGLFIAGGRQTLRPADVTISFETAGAQSIVHINGTFKLIDETVGGDDPVLVRVKSMLELSSTETAK